jgi:hypothetical protein
MKTGSQKRPIFFLVFICIFACNASAQTTLPIDSLACDSFPPPRNLDGFTFDNVIQLWWEVPLLATKKTNTSNVYAIVPENLLGYNVFRDGELLDYIAFDGSDTTFYWDILIPEPGLFCYTISALYGLDSCGFPGDTAESSLEGPICFSCGITFILPFVEEWNTGSFDPNLWTADSLWEVSGQYGNPLPSAQFTDSSNTTNYNRKIVSYYIDCNNHPGTWDPYTDGDFFLEFDIKLDDLSHSGNEFMDVQLKVDGIWHSIFEFSNMQGSFDWQNEKFNVTEQAKGEMIQLVFAAHGLNSSDIGYWFIDNIRLYRQCNPPRELQWLVIDEVMAWRPPIPHTATKDQKTKELQGYKLYYSDGQYHYLDFTTDTFYVLDQSYDSYYVTAEYEDCGPVSNELFGYVDINEIQALPEINIYPNPVDELLTIASTAPISQIRILDINGRVLANKSPYNKKIQLSTASIPNGIYIVEAEISARLFRQKTIVQH